MLLGGDEHTERMQLHQEEKDMINAGLQLSLAINLCFVLLILLLHELTNVVL